MNRPFVLPYPDLTSRLPDARPSAPTTPPKTIFTIYWSQTSQLEPVPSDLTQARWPGCPFRRQNTPREPFPPFTQHRGGRQLWLLDYGIVRMGTVIISQAR